MKVTVYNFKGGVGKSTIAINYALTKDYGIVTNDVHNRIDLIFPKGKSIRLNPDQELPSFPKEFDIVFDFGGYPDARTITAIKQSKAVIIPLFARQAEIQVTLESIKEISQFHKKLIIVVNQPKKGMVETVQNIISKAGMKHPVLPLKTSAGLEKIRQRKKSLMQQHLDSKLPFGIYAEAAFQFEDIIKAVEE